MTSVNRARRRVPIAVAAATLLLAIVTAPASSSDDQLPVRQDLPLPEEYLVRILVPGSDVVTEMQDAGFDLAGNAQRVPAGIEVDAFLTDEQLAALDDFGAMIAGEERTVPEESLAFDESMAEDDTDTVVIGRADWFTTKGQGFLSVEAKSSERQAATLVLSWPGGQANMSAYVDSGQYMYHRVQVPVDQARPDTITVTSSLGDVATATVTDWLFDTEADIDRPGYQYGFIDGYMNPTELYDRIDELAALHPDVAEIVDLPFESNGYRRKAQAILEPPPPPTLPNLVTVDAPSSAAGSYLANGAAFGTPPTQAGVSGAIVLVDSSTGVPSEGCGPLVGFPAGAIALVDRGTCNYTVKVANAQAAGAVAVIVANNTTGNPPNMSGTDATITIPAVHISQANGVTLKAGLPATGTVSRPPAPPPQNPSRVVVDSLVWGHEGGNDISVSTVDPGAPNQPLTVSVTGNAITVRLATDASGALTSTAAQVVAALNDQAGSLVQAYTYRNNAGSGVVWPQAPILLSDFLSAPDEVSREPFEIRALRIGLRRDGSVPGVLIIAQDHAREWVTPLVALEAAERLLANYKTDRATRDILRNVDIFIVVSNNPDGSHYSMFDRSAQRRTMTNHCPLTGQADPLARGNWGVDLNRNYSVGSIFDGYDGASLTCTSDTFAGPYELSEPEPRNIVWLAQTFRNIKFFMTVHSNGGQLFWQPGSYIAQGRITTPRPPLRDEQYYWFMAEDILSNVKALRESVVQPRNVGGSADVLYSSAGNVREELYFNYGIYAFGWEIGGDQWNPATRSFTSGGGFMPQWPEANLQYQEYASGVIKMFEIAKQWGADREPATTHLVQERQPDGTVHVRFEQNEPAVIYFTMDGSQPTASSRVYQASNIREPGETIVVDETTTFRWYSVDVKGHVEAERTRTVNVR